MEFNGRTGLVRREVVCWDEVEIVRRVVVVGGDVKVLLAHRQQTGEILRSMA